MRVISILLLQYVTIQQSVHPQHQPKLLPLNVHQQLYDFLVIFLKLEAWWWLPLTAGKCSILDDYNKVFV
jgi:hypothetical protein